MLVTSSRARSLTGAVEQIEVLSGTSNSPCATPAAIPIIQIHLEYTLIKTATLLDTHLWEFAQLHLGIQKAGG